MLLLFNCKNCLFNEIFFYVAILLQNKLEVKDDIELLYEKTITKFGSGAKIDALKEHLGKKVYVLIRK